MTATRKTRIFSALTAGEISDFLSSDHKEKEHLDFVRVNIADINAETLASFDPNTSDSCGLVIDFLPKSRAQITGLNEALYFKSGQTVHLQNADSKPKENHIALLSEDFENLFGPNEKVYLGFGGLACSVLEDSNSAKSDCVSLTVTLPGYLNPDSYVHVPGTKRQKSPEELVPELPQGVSWESIRNSAAACVVPGYFGKEDIEKLAGKLKSTGNEGPWIFYKIDSEESLKNYRVHLDSFRGVLLSRRELALSIDPALLPIVTKKVLETCHDHAKVVWVASEIFGTMAVKPIPTRAEVSDLANVVIDGAHGVMPSQEIKRGESKDSALQLMHEVIMDMETNESIEPNWQIGSPKMREEMDAIAVGAHTAAKRVGAKAIVCITESGNTACKLASLGPTLPVVGVTFDKVVAKRLHLVRGVQGVYIKGNPKLDEVLAIVKNKIKERTYLEKGDKIVFVSVTLSSVSTKNSNLFTIQTI